MVDADPTERLAERLVDYARVLQQGVGVQDILERLGGFCSDLLHADAIGVLFVDQPSRSLTAGTADSELGRAVERLEEEYGDGPCAMAMRAMERVAAPDLAADIQRYPRFAPPALDLGVGAIHAFPMCSRGEPAGVLNVISRAPIELTDEQDRSAQMVADVTLSYLIHSQHLQEASREAEQLRRALDTRILVEQAKGMLAERHRETPGEAFERMRRYARPHHARMNDVARAVLRGELEL